MKTVGIICEYNPLHLGHQKQINEIRRICGEETAVVCLMSGNFVQRGVPALVDKSIRAEAALRCGADLVLELPVEYALSSAEGFAAGGVDILGKFCDGLCFGAETADKEKLLQIAGALLRDEFKPLLKSQLDLGKSFPAARQAALEQLGLDAALLECPNNILAVEYCKAILATNSPMEPLPIHRGGSYHDELADRENPSATSVRKLMLGNGDWQSFVPEQTRELLASASLHALEYGENAILTRLRTMTEEAFAALPYGSEGLWRKLMHACRREATLEEIISTTKSKRYTRTRIDRMILCAFLGLTEADLSSPVPYTRVLALNDRGRQILKQARLSGTFLNAGEIVQTPYADKERIIGDLYGLFCTTGPEKPGTESKRRIIYKSSN